MVDHSLNNLGERANIQSVKEEVKSLFVSEKLEIGGSDHHFTLWFNIQESGHNIGYVARCGRSIAIRKLRKSAKGFLCYIIQIS